MTGESELREVLEDVRQECKEAFKKGDYEALGASLVRLNEVVKEIETGGQMAGSSLAKTVAESHDERALWRRAVSQYTAAKARQKSDAELSA